ncbi:polyhomeotic-like protein 2 isoform X2 [Tachysurus vachellii]|uniref:polyhomeotic-like protein 2 isoform X2 n=1 Tax=Tachysurus vachellii TaxID=175792 RepID=UPI00296AA744|nr:polyhomeotic-like protein 2 isoform X2 [Tachysurus vachellii]
MERAQASVSSSSSAPAPSNPIITSSSSSNNSQGNASISSSVSSNVSASSRQQTLPQISVYGGIPDRQTVQVIQQALHRQPSTAAQYLQQMYAAQQHHLMLQTAALQQQHLSLAAVQQASIVAGRQNCSQSGTASQQALSSQTTIKLASSPAAAAQLISRAQGANTPPVSITQQAVLLGNSSTPTLTASQAQMYLRAQMLILTPTATVAAVQPEASSQYVNLQSTSPQMQSLVLCSQQGAVASSSSSTTHPQIPGLSVKHSSGGATQVALPSLSVPQLKSLSSQAQGQQGAKPGIVGASEPAKMSDGVSEMNAHVISMSHNVSTATNHPLINTAYAQFQTHQLLQQHKQQFVIQQQPQLPQNSIQTQGQAVQTVAVQPALAGQQCAIPVLPKPLAQQASIFHSTVSPRMLNGQSPVLNASKVKQVQLTAIKLQFQPPPSQTTVTTQDKSDKENAVPPAVRDDCLCQSDQQLLCQPAQEPAVTEQCLYDGSQLTVNAEGPDSAVPVTAAALVCVNVNGNPAMTSGSGNNAPTVTGSTPHNGQSKTPQAIVKPQILTHVIEGFVIQEGAEPFPVERPSLLLENVKKNKQQQQCHSDMEKKVQDAHTADSEMEDLSQQDLKNMQKEPTLSCELCGKVDFAYNFKRSKRFCSTVCAKRYNVGCTKRMGLFPRRPTPENPKKPKASSNHNTNSEAKKQNPSTQTGPVGSAPSPHLTQLCHGESSQCSDMSSYDEPLSPLSVASSGAQRLRKERGADHSEDHSRELPLLTQPFMPSDPAKWNVEEVYEFICSLPGCQEIAEEFRAQEIDGQALLLLKEDHLMSTMNIKLGPALKIFARISMLKDS